MRRLVALLAALPAVVPAAELKLPVSRDTWISAVGSERTGNNGASPRVKLKGIQEFALLDLDPAPLRGKKIVRGALHLHQAGKESLGRVTVSTVAIPWEEGTGTNYEKKEGAACFALPGASPDITAVILGQGGSVWGWADATAPDKDGWQVIEVSPAVLQARVDGRGHGFAVVDDVGNEWTRTGDSIDWRLFPNRFFHSRDQNASVAPYFTVEVADAPAPAARSDSPAPPAVPKAVKLPPEVPAPTGKAFTGLFGEPLGELALARGETGWVRVRGKGLAAPQATAAGCTVTVFPVGAHGDALGTPEPPPTGDMRDEWLVEVRAAKDAPAGRTKLAFANKAELPVRVWAFTLPDVLSFVPQMNAYGLPANERDYYRLAHRYRTCLNVLRYSWRGTLPEGCAPATKPDGTWDWTAWDARFGPLLDGSAFADLPRAGVPVDAFYLPLNENWPMDHEKLHRGGYWVEGAYDPDYWQQFREASSRFARHLVEKKWSQPVFEFYLNGKVYFKADRKSWKACTAPWIFDEPVNAQDFWALRRFGTEFFAGVGEAQKSLRTVFRADISRPEWQRDFLDGICTSEVQSGALRRYRDRSASRQAAFGHRVYMYGSANAIGTPDVQAVAWALDAWTLGADGIVPWQTIGTQDSWTKPDQLSLFYPAKDRVVPSVRLAAMCAAQQTVEYITLLQQIAKLSRADLAAALRAELQLDAGALKKTSEDDAGTLSYAAVTPEKVASLRRRIATWLDAQQPAPKAQLIDWHPPLVAPRPIPHHTVLAAPSR